jgi:Ca2+-binding RTX toxin-like protein
MMAKVTYYTTLGDYAALDDFYDADTFKLSSVTSSKIVFEDTNGAKMILTGKGFDENGKGDITDGTVTGAKFLDADGDTLYQFTSVSVKAKTIYQAFDLSGDMKRIMHGLMSGDDVVTGTANGDYLWGFLGNDTIYGKGGDDVIYGHGGKDTLFGGDGADTLHGYDGADQLSGGDGKDVIYGYEGADVITGGADADTLYGDSGTDKISGGDGKDALDGGDGADTLSGADGDDILSGGAGNDKLTGGDGEDTFEFASGGGKDTITDFDYLGSAHDLIYMDYYLYTGMTKAEKGDDLVLTLASGEQLIIKGMDAEDLDKDLFDFF